MGRCFGLGFVGERQGARWAAGDGAPHGVEVDGLGNSAAQHDDAGGVVLVEDTGGSGDAHACADACLRIGV